MGLVQQGCAKKSCQWLLVASEHRLPACANAHGFWAPQCVCHCTVCAWHGSCYDVGQMNAKYDGLLGGKPCMAPDSRLPKWQCLDDHSTLSRHNFAKVPILQAHPMCCALVVGICSWLHVRLIGKHPNKPCNMHSCMVSPCTFSGKMGAWPHHPTIGWGAPTQVKGT